MKRQAQTPLDFIIDKLTNSIENVVSGKALDTAITQVMHSKQIKKSEWAFNWQTEIKDKSKQVFKLTTANNPTIFRGLISLTDTGDHIFMDLVESAKFNKGRNKLYRGVAGNPVAFACKTSFERHYEGVVSFVAERNL